MLLSAVAAARQPQEESSTLAPSAPALKGSTSLFFAHRFRRTLACSFAFAFAASCYKTGMPARAQSLPGLEATQENTRTSLAGRIIDGLQRPVSGAKVSLHLTDSPAASETTTDASGKFLFTHLKPGSYLIQATTEGRKSSPNKVTVVKGKSQNLVLKIDAVNESQQSLKFQASSPSIEFSDKANFAIAGVTDWTAVGGHGSDATLRTSEEVSREALTLKADGTDRSTSKEIVSPDSQDEREKRLLAFVKAEPQSYRANRDLGREYLLRKKYAQALAPLQNAVSTQKSTPEDEYELVLAYRGVGDLRQARRHIDHALTQEDRADFHRLAGELDESLGDPLDAVQHTRRAAQLDPSEESYFAWGSELLLHRAVWQAAEVFERGARAHPLSARLKTAWGAALFAVDLYDQAAERLCEAADLNSGDPEAYILLGKIDLVSPAPLVCVEPRLVRFVRTQPRNAGANYFYAMALARRSAAPDSLAVDSFLRKAVTLNPHYAAAFLELGILSFAQHKYSEAVGFYNAAITADPQLAEAHYRLGIAYDRIGEADKAKRELQLHGDLQKAQADAVEQQRRQVKQFLVVLQDQPASPKAP